MATTTENLLTSEKITKKKYLKDFKFVFSQIFECFKYPYNILL